MTLYYGGFFTPPRREFLIDPEVARTDKSETGHLPAFSWRDLRFASPLAKKLFDLWLLHLKGETYAQTHGRLRLRKNGKKSYDPLGLLAHLYLKMKISTRFQWEGDLLVDLKKNRKWHARLPKKIRKFYGLSPEQVRKIIYMNDNQRLTFPQIAARLS